MLGGVCWSVWRETCWVVSAGLCGERRVGWCLLTEVEKGVLGGVCWSVWRETCWVVSANCGGERRVGWCLLVCGGERRVGWCLLTVWRETCWVVSVVTCVLRTCVCGGVCLWVP